MSSPSTDASASTGEQVLELSLLESLGIDLPRDAAVLDFGCGAGETMAAFRRAGFVNAVGYDVSDGRSLAEEEIEHVTLGSLLDLQLPYADNTFDLVTSDQVFEHVQDQVRVFEELYRVTKPGGHGIHTIPARYMPLEGHINVPFGGVLQHRWWFKLWATLGVRNQFQQGLSADETADHNALFVTDSTRYVSTSCYRVVWRHVGFDVRFVEQEFFDRHQRSSMRKIGRLGKPAMSLYRTFRSRVVYLHKPVG